MLTCVLLLGSTLVFAACSSAGPGSTTGPSSTPPASVPAEPAGTPGETAPPPAVVASPASPAPSVAAHGHRRESGATFGYTDLTEWARMGGGSVALVQVVSVGPVRWNSQTGARPDETELHRAPTEGEDTYVIGRLVTVRLERLIRGSWTASGPIARYWRPGGVLGADSFDLGVPLAELASGDRAIAFLPPKPPRPSRAGHARHDRLGSPVRIGVRRRGRSPDARFARAQAAPRQAQARSRSSLSASAEPETTRLSPGTSRRSAGGLAS